MSTEAQIKANRQNAQKSTGPKTAGGKAAVSQNAVKHGLFAESLITGEDLAEYQAFRDNMLGELAPVGAVESMLAERVVNLWWRLQRAERMQNEVIEHMIEDMVTNPGAVRRRREHCDYEGLEPDDPRSEPNHLALGRVASSDSSCTRILLYERRIESNLNRAMRELKRFQVIRRVEQTEADKQRSASGQAILSCGMDLNSLKNMARHALSEVEGMAMPQDRPQRKHGALVKQSQFAAAEPNASLYATEGYGNNPGGKAGESKAKLTQLPARELPKGAAKMEESAIEVAG